MGRNDKIVVFILKGTEEEKQSSGEWGNPVVSHLLFCLLRGEGLTLVVSAGRTVRLKSVDLGCSEPLETFLAMGPEFLSADSETHKHPVSHSGDAFGARRNLLEKQRSRRYDGRVWVVSLGFSHLVLPYRFPR